MRSGLGFPEDSTEKLLGELESAPEKSTVPNQPLQFSEFLNSTNSFDEKNQYM